MAKEKVFIQIDNDIIELKGEELNAFLIDQKEMQAQLDAQLTEQNAQRELKISAYTKLGLTEEEINAIL